MDSRISKLRQESLDAIPYLSMERARLTTEFYQTIEAVQFPIPIVRAKALAYLLAHKQLCVNEGELIVGERGEIPKATPTYPEICTHSQEDFDILNTREKVWFKVSEASAQYQKETVTPFWSGRSIRDRIMTGVSDNWKDAYEAGIFTEFMEQRAPGHTVGDKKIFEKGFDDFIAEIGVALDKLGQSDEPEIVAKRDQLQAMRMAGQAIIDYAGRYAEYLSSLAQAETDPERKSELECQARICRHVPAKAPTTFWEALQHYWFVHLGVICELNTWDSFNPGRLDQHLLPFYQADIAEGRLTPEQARVLLQSFWVKFNNQPAPPKVGVTAQESNTYTDFCLINVGGVKTDGEDAVNELTYMILDVIEEMRLLQPSSMVQLSHKNPDKLLHRAFEIIKTGYGQPSLFNNDSIVQELVRQGKSIEDARDGGASGCVEAGAFGKEAYILTGYFNLPKVLELTLHNGTDPRTGKEIGLKTGDPETFKSFDQFYQAFDRQVKHFIDIKISGNLIIERLWGEVLPSPFLSILVDDCIATGKDYNCGGARYNTSYIQGVGMGTTTDCLTAIKYHLYDKKTTDVGEFKNMLASNFEGLDKFRGSLLDETPKYGNDNDYADDILRQLFETYFEAVDGRPNVKGGVHRVNLLPTTCHVYFGSVIGALPDGRLAGEPVSEGISPVQGADRHGPTAVLKSAAKIDHLRTGGTLLNQKFTPQVFDSEQAIIKIAHLVRAYFKMDGHHIQFNVVNAETLRKAQENPENYKDLIVRVAGYSDYFVDLGQALQDEIIHRTEQA